MNRRGFMKLVSAVSTLLCAFSSTAEVKSTEVIAESIKPDEPDMKFDIWAEMSSPETSDYIRFCIYNRHRISEIPMYVGVTSEEWRKICYPEGIDKFYDAYIADLRN